LEEKEKVPVEEDDGFEEGGIDQQM